jgi:hypothetical protein
MARVSTARTRAARRDEIARIAATPRLRLRWGKILSLLLCAGGGALLLWEFTYLLGQFIARNL